MKHDSGSSQRPFPSPTRTTPTTASACQQPSFPVANKPLVTTHNTHKYESSSFSHNPPSIYRQRALQQEDDQGTFGGSPLMGLLLVVVTACALLGLFVFAARLCLWCLYGIRLPSRVSGAEEEEEEEAIWSSASEEEEDPAAMMHFPYHYARGGRRHHHRQQQQQHPHSLFHYYRLLSAVNHQHRNYNYNYYALVYDNGNLARHAGLAPGLLMSERNRILRSFFEARKCSYLGGEGRRYSSSNDESNRQGIDNENDTIVEVSGDDHEDVFRTLQEQDHNVDNDDDGDDDSCNKAALGRPSGDSIVASALDLIRGSGGGAGDHTGGHQSGNPPQQQRHDRNTPPQDYETYMCSICLTDYTEEDVELIHGTQCSHVFHYHCCIEWLKEKDHCPYCRKEMISPQEYRHAAVQTLGRERVHHLSSTVAPR